METKPTKPKPGTVECPASNGERKTDTRNPRLARAPHLRGFLRPAQPPEPGPSLVTAEARQRVRRWSGPCPEPGIKAGSPAAAWRASAWHPRNSGRALASSSGAYAGTGSYWQGSRKQVNGERVLMSLQATLGRRRAGKDAQASGLFLGARHSAPPGRLARRGTLWLDDPPKGADKHRVPRLSGRRPGGRDGAASGKNALAF